MSKECTLWDYSIGEGHRVHSEFFQVKYVTHDHSPFHYRYEQALNDRHYPHDTALVRPGVEFGEGAQEPGQINKLLKGRKTILDKLI